MSNDLTFGLDLPTRVLPDHVRLFGRPNHRWASPFAPHPLQMLHHYYELVRQRVRIGTRRLTVSAAWRTPSRTRPLTGSEHCIGTRLPTFRVVAADQTRAVFTPDTAWPINGHPPDSSQSYAHPPPVLMPSLIFRRFLNGSLALAFLIPA